jgi:hypothetical protein
MAARTRINFALIPKTDNRDKNEEDGTDAEVVSWCRTLEKIESTAC